MEPKDSNTERRLLKTVAVSGTSETRVKNEYSGPAEIELVTTAGSIIRFTLPPGGFFDIQGCGDIKAVNITRTDLDTSEGLRIVKDD